MPDDGPTRLLPPGAQPGLVRDRLTRPGTPSPRSVFHDVPNMPWEDTKFEGIKMKLLYNDPATGMATMLMRLAPGATVPLHEHTAIEQTYVLEGRFLDEEGECLPGQFVWRPEGNTHVAWAGPEGATILGIFLKPNIFDDGRKFFSEGKPEA
jgi:anti-sigma factor ChrR (cupin superfamily)